MSSFEELFSPFRAHARFQSRVAGKTLTGVVNTGIDVANLFRDLDDQFKPIDLDDDVYRPAIQTAANTVADITNPNRGAQARDFLRSMTRAPESTFGEMGEDATVFMLGFLGGRKAIQSAIGATAKGAQAGRAMKYGVDLAAGAGSAFVLEDPEGERLVNFIPEKHRPAFLDYLAYDPDADESRIEGRFKNALVDMGLGVLADGAFGLIAKSFKHARRSIHLEAAGDPELAAKLAKETLGVEGSVKPPKEAPKVDLSSNAYAKATAKESIGPEGAEGFAKGTPEGPEYKSQIDPETEAKVIETILKAGPDLGKGEDMADVYFRAINHTHMDFTDEDSVVETTNAILKAIYKDLDTRGVQSWDEVYAQSDTMAKEGHLKSFETMAKLTDDTVANVQRATPATMLIRRMFAESAEEFNKKMADYYMLKAGKTKRKLARELRDRLSTHIMLTTGLSRLGTAAGRLLSSFRALVGGDLGAFDTPVKKMVKEKVVKEASGAKGKPKKPSKPRKPRDVAKDAQTKVKRLTKELDKLRKRFGDDSKLKDPKAKVPDSPEVKDLKERIAFYKGAEADAKRVTKLEGKLEALKQLAARGTKLDLEAGTGKLKLPPKLKTPEIVALEKEIANVIKEMEKKLKALEPPPSVAERVQEALQADDPERALFKAIREVEDDELQELMKVLEGFDASDARQWLSSKGEATPKSLRILQTLRKIRMMNILSGIPTFVTNTVGGITTTLFRKGFEDVIASLVPSSAGDRMRFLGEVRAFRSTLQQPMELFNAGFKGLAEAHKSGKSTSDIFAGLAVDDITRLREEGLDLDLLIRSDSTAARIINGYGKLAHAMSYGHMTVGDQFIKQSGFGGEATSIAYGKGVLKGLKGEALDNYTKTMTEQSIFLARKGKEGAKYMLDSLQKKQGLSLEDAWKHLKEVSEIVKDGRTYAKDGVFQGEIDSKTLRGLEKWLNQQNAGTHLLKTMVFPFFRTPVKIVEFSLERTPILQAISRKWRADFRGHNGTRAKQRAIAKFFSGSMMYSGAFALANSNMITGKHRPEERDALIASGIPEYSIRIPHTDEWIAFQRADPFAMFLGISADLNKLVEEGKLDAGTAMAASMNALSSNVLNKTFMKGLSDSLKAANSPAEFGAYYSESQLRSIVSPLSSFQRSFEKVWNANSEEYRKQKPDPALTELRGWVDIMLGDTGLTGTREYDMTDALGNKVERGSLWSELTGFRGVETTTSPAMRELALHKRMPKNRELTLATGFKMTQEEFLEFKKILGEDVRLKERLDRVVRTSKYRNASNEAQVKLLDKVIRDSRKVAKSIMLRRDPTLRSQVIEHKRNRLLGSLQAAEVSSGIPTIDRILKTRRETGNREDIL